MQESRHDQQDAQAVGVPHVDHVATTVQWKFEDFIQELQDHLDSGLWNDLSLEIIEQRRQEVNAIYQQLDDSLKGLQEQLHAHTEDRLAT